MMPKLKGMRFAMAILECCKCRETSVEEVMIEMYLAGVSTKRIENLSEILWELERVGRHNLQPEQSGL